MEASRFKVLGFSGSFLSEEKDVEALKGSFVSWLASDLQSIPYENLVRADPRNINVPNREGVERAKGKAWRTGAPYVRNRNARSWRDHDDDAGTIPGWYIKRIGLGTMTTMAQTGGARGSECAAEADAIAVVAQSLFNQCLS